MSTVLGELDRKLIIQDFDTHCPNRNIFVVGGPGSSKSSGYVIPNIIMKTDESIVTIDPKGEIYENTAKIKKMQGFDVRVVNFKNFLASDRQNFFDYIDKDSDASIVAEMIVRASGDSKTKKDVWYKASVGLLNAIILYIKYEFEPKKRNMENLIKFIQNNKPKAEGKDGVAELDKRFAELPIDHPAREKYEFGFDVSEDRTRASILLTFVSDLSSYIDKEVRSYSSDSDFDLKDIGRKKTIVYVMLPVLGNTVQSLSSLFFTQLFQQLYRLGDNNGAKLPYPVSFLLDEFPNIGVIPDYEETLATCRGYGISISTIVQNISQLTDKYGKEKASSILGNHAVILCLGNVEIDTAEYIKKELGNTTVEFETSGQSSSSGKDSSSKSSNKNVSYTSRPLMNTDEITALPQNQAILITKNSHPAKINKIAYYKLFPGLTEKYMSRQNEYKRSKNKEMINKHFKLNEEWKIKEEEIKERKRKEHEENERKKQEIKEEQKQNKLNNEVTNTSDNADNENVENNKSISDTKASFYAKLSEKDK
ncbi:VirD4-like conjugal transfer protein, CD1115 family [Macrococcus armenti]|uniref:VirD4-like conjugal transfer protein, CD1115 family n=1 Tax=Macrococcus armenti TaxID=2875764 RepID=UPI001CCCDCC8|nr:type IV secretory system conjugative DNA transfer family protein [Macrococcus armenti]UBH09799.1 type IV secretory system conjugative DNA transfer family protein [Macrococcus armenti]